MTATASRRDLGTRGSAARRRTRAGALTGAVAAAALALAPAWTASARPVASYEMDEGPTATRLVDARGAFDGTIGADVTTAVAAPGGGRAHGFPAIGKTVVRRQHLDVVAHRAALNPGTGRFSVAVRFRTTENEGNILQKGQSRSAGGYYKIETPYGKPRCIFRDADGRQRTGFGRERVDDGQWHTVRCVRTATAVTMYVDGERAGRRTGPTGRIANTRPLTIGGKYRCNGRAVECDYFIGQVDFVRIGKG